jgi:hydrogenase nickel incorporation protein HypB
MCTTCGCGGPDGASRDHRRPHHHRHDHEHGDGARRVRVEQEILAKNNAFAAANRSSLEGRGVLAVNLLSSPGSGKTTLLVCTLEALREEVAMGVIEGDQQSRRDADRIRATSVPAVQINTGAGCHLDAHQVAHAMERLNLPQGGILFIENVGNLVCPAAFDLGEAHKVVILSVPEGDDKPLKYPNMFAAADLLVVNKVDLLPHVQFDVDRCVEYARRIRPGLPVLHLSATTGEGMEGWLGWIASAREQVLASRQT